MSYEYYTLTRTGVPLMYSTVTGKGYASALPQFQAELKLDIQEWCDNQMASRLAQSVSEMEITEQKEVIPYVKIELKKCNVCMNAGIVCRHLPVVNLITNWDAIVPCDLALRDREMYGPVRTKDDRQVRGLLPETTTPVSMVEEGTNEYVSGECVAHNPPWQTHESMAVDVLHSIHTK